LVRFSDLSSVIPRGHGYPISSEPRHGLPATVYVGFQDQGENTRGRPSYNVVKIYDDPPPPHSNQDRNNLREIEVDDSGNVYVINTGYTNISAMPAKCGGADLDGTGDVSLGDFTILASQWRQGPGTPSADIAPEPAGDGIVNFRDLAVLADYRLDTGCD